ncbi:MAG: hypothetical protein HY850_00035 [Betaproteobacteria bacterium]|nr:hypothetical protein [Betaproteobacteria bacterium]
MRIGAVGTGSVDYFSVALRRAGQDNSAQADQQREAQRLKQVDQKVRAHERAHLSAAAGLATGGASFQYVRGPDGRQYAVGGEVQIDVSAASTPEQTIAKAQRIRAAALAPADPSSQDRAVAAAAGQLESQARAELNRQKRQESGAADPLQQAGQTARQAADRYSQKAIAAYTHGATSASPATTDIYA